jgi:hypothetical protein
MLLSLLLTACSSDMTMGADALARLDDMRSAVSAHKDTVDKAASMDEVTTEESDHATAMAAMMDDMDTMMGSMMGCAMDDMMSGSMSDADGHMADMMDAVSGHEAAHADHVDMQGCMDEEATYSTAMADHLDAMATDMDGFDETAECSSGGGMTM